MNIFIMILLTVFMLGYYMISSPSTKIPEFETENAIAVSDIRGIAECTTALHNAKIKDGTFEDVCIEQHNITSEFICLNNNLSITPCEVNNKRKPAYSFIITATAPIPNEKFDAMMQVLEKYYADAGTFGIFQGNSIVSGGTINKRIVPKSVIAKMGLTDGQLIYMTQYEIPDADKEYSSNTVFDITCPAGTAKTYRFGRWQCIGINTKTDCAGDMIWDANMSECVPDESRKPLCAETQNAVMTEDDVWECVDPFADRVCPNNMTARLNYTNLEWECVPDPTQTDETTKCAHITRGVVYGRHGTTLRVPPTSCTDCERMIVNNDTCESVCVPDISKLENQSCYPGNVNECSGSHKAIYFGFPSTAYAKNVSQVSDKNVVIDSQHVQNRKFNCLDCGDLFIDKDNSIDFYTATCKQ